MVRARKADTSGGAVQVAAVVAATAETAVSTVGTVREAGMAIVTNSLSRRVIATGRERSETERIVVGMLA
jgi:hypothetical protein